LSPSHLNSKKKIKVVLVGGLGNQLFTYVAGLLLSKTHGKKLILDFRRIPYGYTNHEVSIASFSIEGIFINGKRINFLTNLALRFEDYFLTKFEISRKIAESIGLYFSKVVGFDPAILEASRIRTLNGYFQSYKYLQILETMGFKLQLNLKSESAWYLTHEVRILDEKPIVMHIRRGDYKSLSDDFGCLSAKYYAEALIKAREIFPNRKVWVFSDDLESAKQLIDSINIADIELIDDSNSNGPAESLKLMSIAAVNIIANSTFSWWSAALNNNSELVIAPLKWFKGMKDPDELIPPNWIRVQSYWD